MLYIHKPVAEMIYCKNTGYIPIYSQYKGQQLALLDVRHQNIPRFRFEHNLHFYLQFVEFYLKKKSSVTLWTNC